MSDLKFYDAQIWRESRLKRGDARRTATATAGDSGRPLQDAPETLQGRVQGRVQDASGYPKKVVPHTAAQKERTAAIGSSFGRVWLACGASG